MMMPPIGEDIKCKMITYVINYFMFPNNLLLIPTEILRVTEELEGVALLVHANMRH